MFVNQLDDINAQIDQIDWRFFEKKKWNPLKEPQTYLCAVFAVAFGLLVTGGCAHKGDAADSQISDKHDSPRRY